MPVDHNKARHALRHSQPSAPRELLKDRAYRELKELIQTGALEPHSSVSERQLVARLGMSKTPIRAALESLESQGLVAVSPQKGILIKELSAREIGELFDVRHAVEPYIAARLSRRRISEQHSAALRDNLRQQALAAKSEDAVAATRLDIQFHQMLGLMLDNQEIIAWLTRCFDKLHRSILRINRLAQGRLRKSAEDHVGIADAIADGDEQLASGRMLAHLRYGRQFLLGVDHDDLR